MQHSKPVPVVDLFAGPGGLGEGFSALNDGTAFKTLVSAEMEVSAHQTLTLRAFYRILKNEGSKALASYYRFCNGEQDTPWDDSSLPLWEKAKSEARCITLGSSAGNRELNSVLNQAGIDASEQWVLIGGPPCQAYSLVGRSRNQGKVGYQAEEDHRHFLYKEYLKIIHRYHPAVFVMENVKGILSSKVGENLIFHSILRDLADPDMAVGKRSGFRYRIHSLVTPTVFEYGMDPHDIDVHDYVVRSEEYGIPQARHRVILLGIRDDIDIKPRLLKNSEKATVHDAISDLPPLRSRLSKERDSTETWARTIEDHLEDLLSEAKQDAQLAPLARVLRGLKGRIGKDLSYVSQGSGTQPRTPRSGTPLHAWYSDSKLKVLLNHEARGHMSGDLRRYLYAAAYAEAFDRSPKGHEEFTLSGLHPDHKNWKSGKFADRFRVQLASRPATTVTSHIAKDGHYFIHPDPAQCRSLTVREAARLQTFPDNYFFQGNRTQQFHQVGNAVPPLLASKIAEVVRKLLASAR